MNKQQIRQAAEKYADDNFIDRIVKEEPWPTAKRAFAKAFIDGADFALSRQWVSVEDALPEIDKRVLVRVPKTDCYLEYYAVAYWDGEDFVEHQRSEVIRPSHWLSIPTLNIEKE